MRSWPVGQSFSTQTPEALRVLLAGHTATQVALYVSYPELQAQTPDGDRVEFAPHTATQTPLTRS